MEKTIVKTIRFSEEEMKQINLLIENNPYLDFSTIVRMSISQFVSDPVINLGKRKSENKKHQRNARLH